jgi:hypothetical protein
MSISTSSDFVVVETRGNVTGSDGDYARERVTSLLRYARDPVLFARVRLTLLTDPALARPAVAQVNLDVDGRLVRAQVARPTMREAVDEVHDRARDRLIKAAGDWQDIRGRRPTNAAHEWRHQTPPSERPPHFPRPAEDRQIVRHKAFSLARMTVDEAAFDMDMLDYAFHLFSEQGSGVDSVLYRVDDGVGYRLAQLRPVADHVAFGVTPVTVSNVPAPDLTVDDAIERLNVTAWPFVFFRDTATGRGAVVYYRYDGHYGLITPPA